VRGSQQNGGAPRRVLFFSEKKPCARLPESIFATEKEKEKKE